MVHREQIAITLADLVFTKPGDGGGEIQIYAQASFTHAATFITNRLGRAGSDVARRQIAERGIHAFEIIIAVALGDVLRRFLAIFLFLWHPNASVVAE